MRTSASSCIVYSVLQRRTRRLHRLPIKCPPSNRAWTSDNVVGARPATVPHRVVESRHIGPRRQCMILTNTCPRADWLWHC